VVENEEVERPRVWNYRRQQILAWKYKPSGKRIKESRRCWKEAFVGSKDKKLRKSIKNVAYNRRWTLCS
jgi:hypothetical protein